MTAEKPSAARNRGQGRTLWIATGLAAVIVALLVFAAMHVRITPTPPPGGPPAPGTRPTIAISHLDRNSTNRSLQDQVSLYDPTPLFLPTPVNCSDPDLPPAMSLEPGATLPPFPARLHFAEYEMKVAFPEPIAVPAGPVDALKTGLTANPCFTLGRLNYDYKPLPRRTAYVEVLQAKTGRSVYAGPVVLPEREKSLPADWLPVELVAAVDSAGLVADPMVTSGSGSEETDNFIRHLIVNRIRLGLRLPPGFYAIRIGP